MARKAKKRCEKIISICYCTMIYIFLFLPITVVVANSFNGNRSKPYLTWKGFTFEWYGKLFANKELIGSFQTTLLIAVLSTIVATMVGSITAIGMYRFKFKGKGMIDALLYIPVAIPEIVLGISLLTLFSNIRISRGIITLVLAHATFSMPFVIFNVRARLAGYDTSIEEASLDLGANRVTTFFQITLPVLAPGIAGGALLAFTLSIDDVIVSYFVNGQVKTFPLKVMESIKSGVAPDVNALSTLILIGTVIVVVLTQSNVLKRKIK